MNYPPINSPQGTVPILGAEAADYSAVNAVPTFGVARAIYVGVSGNLKIDCADGSSITLTALAAGQWHPIACAKVYNVGSTAGMSVLFGR